MFVAHVRRGVTAGLIAGLVFGLLIALVANPLVGFADELGHSQHGADGHHAAGGQQGGHSGDHHDRAVSMAVTNVVSVVSGVLWGLLLGAVVFGVVYYFLEPAIPGTDGTKSYLLAGAGFVTVSGAPWLVLPPQPPGVEQALSPTTRLFLYGGMMVSGALVCLLAGFVYARIRTRGRVIATVAALLPFGLLVLPVVLSPANPVERSLPPELASGLTGMIVFGQAMLWVLLAGLHTRFRRRSRSHSDSSSDSRSTSEIGPARADGGSTD